LFFRRQMVSNFLGYASGVFLNFKSQRSKVLFITCKAYSDVLVSFAVGVSVYFLLWLFRGARFDHLRETIVAFLVTVIACVAKDALPNIHTSVVVVSSLIILIPGLSLIAAISECANKYTGSGASRSIGTLVDFFKIGAGVVIAHYLIGLQISDPNAVVFKEYSTLIVVIASVLCAISAGIVFNAEKNDLWKIALVCAAAIQLLGALRETFNSNFSMFICVVTISSFCTLYSQKANKFSSTYMLPVLLFLVPGAIGLVGINFVLESNLDMGVSALSNALLIGISIVSGLFFADAITFRKTKSGTVVIKT